MHSHLDTGIGVAGGVVFLSAGIAILAWGTGQLRLARASRDWPTVKGEIVTSRVDDRKREHRPHVQYSYVVDGTRHTSSQISFDIFNKPGGAGRIDSIVARYRAGDNVTVFYHPSEPAISILEPEVYSPFFKPLYFSGLFIFFGLFILRNMLNRAVIGDVGQQGSIPKNRRVTFTTIMSVLMHSLVVMSTLESAARDTFAKAFGERPAGMPVVLFVFILRTILCLPMPWVFWHGMRLLDPAGQDPKSDSKRLASKLICIGGALYFILICAAWIAYTDSLGI